VNQKLKQVFLKNLTGFFAKGLLRLIDFERFLFDEMIPCDREALRSILIPASARQRRFCWAVGARDYAILIQRPRDGTNRRHASRCCEPGR
jgi:hypothetical protein